MCPPLSSKWPTLTSEAAFRHLAAMVALLLPIMLLLLLRGYIHVVVMLHGSRTVEHGPYPALRVNAAVEHQGSWFGFFSLSRSRSLSLSLSFSQQFLLRGPCLPEFIEWPCAEASSQRQVPSKRHGWRFRQKPRR